MKTTRKKEVCQPIQPISRLQPQNSENTIYQIMPHNKPFFINQNPQIELCFSLFSSWVVSGNVSNKIPPSPNNLTGRLDEYACLRLAIRLSYLF